jgi:hypothetical protein
LDPVTSSAEAQTVMRTISGAHACNGQIKNLKGAARRELNLSARRPTKWAEYELFSRSETVRVPGG